MPKIPDDDLFADSTMTFGEHLEELRGALFRALLGLVVGFLLGLLVGKWVVWQIKAPLEDALVRYYVGLAKKELHSKYGKDLPEGIDELLKQGITFEEVFLERRELERIAAELGGGSKPVPERSGSPSVRGSGGVGSPAPSTFWSRLLGHRPPAAGGPKEDANLLHEKAPPPDPQLLQTGVRTRIWRTVSAKVTTLSAQEAFMIWLKAAFVTGLLIAGPYIFWQLWVFVAAGLYPHEKRFVYIYLPMSVALFWSGAALAFFAVFRYVLDFLLSFNASVGIQAEPRISEWMTFVLFLPLGFGIAFQLPLVMLFLNRITVLSIEAYLSKWRISVLVIFVLSAILTPADPVSMLLMAAPLCLLYFLGIALCKWMPKTRSPFREGYDV